MKNIADINTIRWTNLERVLNDFADYFIQEARTNIGNNGSYATGTLADTMEKIVEISGNSYKVSVRIADYWNYVENGRKKGKFPPPHRIKEWISVKPITPTLQKTMLVEPSHRGNQKKVRVKVGTRNGKLPTVDQLAYLIGRKIATEGIKPKPFFQPAKEDAIARYQNAIDYAIAEDIAVWVEEKVLQQGIYDELFRML